MKGKGKGKGRHVVRNIKCCVGEHLLCCLCNMVPGMQRATKLLLEVSRTAVGRFWSLKVERLGKSDPKILIKHLRSKTTIDWIVVKSV